MGRWENCMLIDALQIYISIIGCCLFGGIVCLEITRMVMWLTKEVTLEKDSAKGSLKVGLYEEKLYDGIILMWTSPVFSFGHFLWEKEYFLPLFLMFWKKYMYQFRVHHTISSFKQQIFLLPAKLRSNEMLVQLKQGKLSPLIACIPF